MLWRVFGGQVHEAWDIPTVNTTRSPKRVEAGGPRDPDATGG